MIESTEHSKINDQDTFIFCGAKGSDTEWKKLAKRLGHKFITHDTYDTELDKYFNTTLEVNRVVGRTFPTKNEYLNRLLLRNIKTGLTAKHLYVIGEMDLNLNILGGTIWACATFIYFNEDPGSLFFFDQHRKIWFYWNKASRNLIPEIPLGVELHKCSKFKDNFRVLSGNPPTPTGLWSGIGTRLINESGKAAIDSITAGIPLV